MGIAWDKDLKCDNCGSLIESVYHVLWICPIARAVWKRMLRMLYPIYGKHVYTLGFLRWGRLAKEIHNYEEYVDFFSFPMEDMYWRTLILQQFVVWKRTRSSLRYLLL